MQEKTSNTEDLFERIQLLVTQCDPGAQGRDWPGGSDRGQEDAQASEAFEIAFAAERFHLHALVQDAVSIMQRRASAKGLASGVDMTANCPRLIVGDEARVRQALMALIEASLQSTEDGSIRLYVSVNDAGNPAIVRFDVTDTSAGLEPEEQGALFEGTPEQESPDGIGVSQARRLAEAMGGGVGCESAVGQGTLYWFTFEAAIVDETVRSKAAPVQTPNDEGQDGTKETGLSEALTGHVLIVEDNTVNRLLIGAYLEEFGLSYDMAESGTTALMCLAARAYDLVLMDASLPDYDGTQMAERIRTLQGPSSQVPIVALTTRQDEEEGQAFLEAGVNGCMTKPVHGSALKAAMGPFLPAADGEIELATAS